jgi:hypothetical protein
LDLWFCFWYTQQLNNGHTELGCQSLLEKTLLYRHPQKITRRRNPLELSIHQKKERRSWKKQRTKKRQICSVCGLCSEERKRKIIICKMERYFCFKKQKQKQPE